MQRVTPPFGTDFVRLYIKKIAGKILAAFVPLGEPRSLVTQETDRAGNILNRKFVSV